MRQANSAIVRERHPISTVDKILHGLNGSTVFATLDIKWAFHQVELRQKSRPITTFVTHNGLFRKKTLMFGISSTSEMYLRVMQQALQGCESVRNIHGDGLTLNKEKHKFHMSEIEFTGHLLSTRGIRPTQAKGEAVTEARKPESVVEVSRFLGLVNFCARFIPDLPTVSEPLRRLTRKDVPGQWGKEQDKAFNELKKRLANTETLGYFDKDAETCLITDASPVGLGAVLTLFTD